MTMKIDIQDQYVEEFENLLSKLPADAIEIKRSIDEEVDKRVEEYRSGKTKTVPFGTGLDEIKEKLISKL